MDPASRETGSPAPNPLVNTLESEDLILMEDLQELLDRARQVSNRINEKLSQIVGPHAVERQRQR